MYFYILFSKKLNRFYKGVSDDPERRLIEHNTALKATAYTAIANDWEIVFKIKCTSKTQALKIEMYFKKSANINYLKRFMVEKELQDMALERFRDCFRRDIKKIFPLLQISLITQIFFTDCKEIGK